MKPFIAEAICTYGWSPLTDIHGIAYVPTERNL